MNDFVMGAALSAAFALVFAIFQYLICHAELVHDRNKREREAHEQRVAQNRC